MSSGLLHTYNMEPNLALFESGNLDSHTVVIGIGGLGDSLGTLPYAHDLGHGLGKAGLGLVSIGLTSSGKGFGVTNVTNDAKEIHQAIEYLVKERKKKSIIVLGHSTGCQDAVTLVNLDLPATTSQALKGIILQAPASDREYIATVAFKPEDYEAGLVQARDQAARGEGDLPLLRRDVFSLFTTAISASRWLSLAQKPDTDDFTSTSEDYFSSDLSDRRYDNLFGGIKVPVVWLIGKEDEFYPPAVDKEDQLKRFVKATYKPSQYSQVLAGANHTIDAAEARQHFIDIVIRFAKTLS